ncbi:exo-beta-N-acetylmuramidase NamZ domain-containing protein [Paenibacillus sp. GCM10027627]|uniref:exo-beta-N-acetylmuramidase NamZ family protein n=1 Tax=unclassified Paenibacillus TaxID=185978 RepID=UPI00363B5062
MILNGIDRISEYEPLFRGKRIGLITSPTGLSAEFRSTIDILHERFGLSALFSPEHGVRGDMAAGALVDTYEDPATGVPVYSLYRKDSKRLSKQMLDAVDIVVYDIQDVGTRYYTFIYTMLFALEDCAGAGKPFVVLDRYNPLDGNTVEGNVLKEKYSSFVGNYPLAVRYGLTGGEVAVMANEERGWNAELHVIKCEGWSREMTFSDTGKVWIPPSMGIPRFHIALLYPGTCLFEGTNLSEGRGTTAPFEMIGAPFVDSELLAREMNGQKLPGVHFRPVFFKPTFSKHEGELCGGVYVHVLDEKAVRPVELGVRLLFTVQRLFEPFAFLPPVKENGRPFIDLLGGDNVYRDESVNVSELLEQFREESRLFAVRKKRFHLY